MQQPGSIAYDPSGAYFVADYAACVIRKVAPDGVISTVAGNGTCGYAGDGGSAVDAQINPASATSASSLARDSSGNLYLAEPANGRIRKIATDGTITSAASGFDTSLGAVYSVAVSTSGTLFAATTLDGLVSVDTSGTTTQVISGIIIAVAADPAGGLFYSDLNHTIWHLDEASTTPTTVATLTTIATGLTADASGNVYATTTDDWSVNNHVVSVSPDGIVNTIAGNGSPDPGTRAQQGDARSMALTPMGVAATKNRGLLVSSGHVVYRLDHPAQAVTAPGVCDTVRFHPGVDLSNQNLAGTNFADCDLTGANLASTDLTNANLSGATLSGVRSGGVTGSPAALPTGWVLKSGYLIGPGADMSGMIVFGGDFAGVDFTGVNLSGTGFGLSAVDLSGADLSGAVLTAPPLGFLGADLTGANLSGLDLSTSALQDSVLTGANIDGTDLSNATLSGVISGGLVGTPAALPAGWTLVDGSLVPPPPT